ncbi:hypothetical protein LTR37_013378 [Vermiconidia calcicola]|uniref:Uncharacterized protein n=1 Tax=Vermiconidia calcicola TaxID=1690605 RepID=A0ACC3MWG4_9PEZI|nr:hypothetical protein LTR37_013378 [Vermiconidia calcicola]
MVLSSHDGYLLNTSDDHSGLIVIFAAVGICWSITVLVTRLAGSISSRRDGLGWEDYGIVGSTCVGVASSIAIFFAVKDGLGRTGSLNTTANESRAAKALYASDILYVVALAFSKLATLQLITALSPVRWHKQACLTLSLFTILWAVTGVVILSLRCNLSNPWQYLEDTSTQCSDLVRALQPKLKVESSSLTIVQLTRWASLESISLLIECLIFAIAAAMIHILQMPRRNKAKAMFAFAIRLPVVLPVILRLIYLQIAFDSNDFELKASGSVLATQCALHYSIMSASFSYLKTFLAAFDSNLGASIKLETVVATRSGDRTIDTGSGNRPTRTAAGYTNAERGQPPRSVSEDSKAPIIFKTQTYRVEAEG